jgi:hypothetical protein
MAVVLPAHFLTHRARALAVVLTAGDLADRADAVVVVLAASLFAHRAHTIVTVISPELVFIGHAEHSNSFGIDRASTISYSVVEISPLHQQPGFVIFSKP